MQKKVLITGASGFVGYHLIEQALACGFQVYAAVRQSSSVDHLKGFKVSYTHLNYADVDGLRKEIVENGYDYIIHASGTTKAKSLKDYNLVNAEYSRNLALAAVGTQVKKFVFVSSLAAIGPLEDVNGRISATQQPKPVTSYGVSKLQAETYLKAIEGLPLLTIRPTAVYGPREKDIFILFSSINKGLEPYIGRFDQRLSFVYVKDLAAVILKALDSTLTHQSYNISDGRSYDRFALAKYAKNLLSKKTLKFYIPLVAVRFLASFLDMLYAKSSATPALNKEKLAELTAVNWICDIEKARMELGFTPEYNLEQGLSQTMQWYKANKWL
jgi:nucleoside-diphosphate-sugar epimerase